MKTIIIVNLSDLSILNSYKADEPSQSSYGGPWGDPSLTSHIELPDGMVASCASVAIDGTVTEDSNKREAYDSARAADAAIEQGLLAQQLGTNLLAQIFAFNEANLKSGTLSPSGFAAMMADSTIANIERFLSNGSFESALALIIADTNLTTYFSADQISAMEAAVTAAIATRG